MCNLISGKEALIALANGEDVEFKRHVNNSAWLKAKELKASEILNHCMVLESDNYSIEFRLKPRTITINGIEVPAPFKPKAGEQAFYITAFGNYDSLVFDWKLNDFGYWRTEEEIKQVVAALREVFK